PYTSRSQAAQRIAKIELRRHRQEQTVTLPCLLHAFQVQAGETVGVTNTVRSWDDKPFEVLESSLVPYTDAAGEPVLGVNLNIRETDPSVFTFALTDETAVDPSPVPIAADPFTIVPPTDLVLTSGNAALFTKADGTVVSRIKASFTASVDHFVHRYEVQFRATAGSPVPDWEPAGGVDHVAGATLSLFIWDVEDGAIYDVRVRAMSTLGRFSDYVIEENHTVAGKTAAPPDVDTFTVTRLADGRFRSIVSEGGAVEEGQAGPPMDLFAPSG
ncbi:MAG: hypothetical protein IH985_03820, partial [Planctomycetes bacterium]|nr:hypothetical protein [Planctomycetota bacterium]